VCPIKVVTLRPNWLFYSDGADGFEKDVGAFVSSFNILQIYAVVFNTLIIREHVPKALWLENN
jgi:hypothetical protein